jgi:hypothetical protein
MAVVATFAVGVDLVENTGIQIESAIGALINNSRYHRSSSASVSHLYQKNINQILVIEIIEIELDSRFIKHSDIY